MYGLIEALINHSWVSNYSGDQQYIYYICSAVICIMIVVFIDLTYRVIRSFIRK